MPGFLGSGDIERASLWRRLAAMERAGIPIQKSIATAVEQGGAAPRLLSGVQHDLDQGLGLDEAFGRAAALEELERRLIGAGAKGGRLPDVLDDLATHFEDRAATKRAMAASLAYPVFLVHAAAVLTNLPVLVQDKGGLGPFLVGVLTPLAVLYGVTIAGVVGWRALRAANRAGADAFLLHVPLLGGLVRKRALAASLDVVRMLYASGVSVLDAVESAASACPNAAVGAVFERIRARMQDGMTIAQAFSTEPMIPPQVQSMISTGAASGALDDLMGRSARALDEEAKLARRALLAVLGTVAFLLAAGFVAYKIFSFWMGYFDQFKQAF